MTGYLIYQQQQQIKPLLPFLQMEHGKTVPAREEGQQEISDSTRPSVVIRWGDAGQNLDESDFHVINRYEGIINCINEESRKNILQINGIPIFHGKRTSCLRTYYAIVFQQEVVGLYRSRDKKGWVNPQADIHAADDKFYEIPVKTGNLEIRKVTRMAQRSIYALGLDFGGVMIGITASGKRRILHVTPVPRLTSGLAEKMAALWQDYVIKYKQMQDGLYTPVSVLGADPEFVLRHAESGQIILASRYFKKTGSVGCDAIWLREDRSRNQLPLAELRPVPHENPRQLVVNLYRTMIDAIKQINEPEVEWLAGGMPLKGYPIGGHIHFSDVWLNSHLLRCLDNYLALPLVLIESKASIRRRPRYGFLGDIRMQFHGGFEYRTLPSWLMSPRITKGVIALAKMLTSSFLQLNEFPLLNGSVQQAFYEGDKGFLTPIVENMIEHLIRLEDYQDFAVYLDPFFEQILSGEEWDEHRDIRVAWRLPPYHHDIIFRQRQRQRESAQRR